LKAGGHLDGLVVVPDSTRSRATVAAFETAPRGIYPGSSSGGDRLMGSPGINK